MINFHNQSAWRIMRIIYAWHITIDKRKRNKRPTP